VICEDSLRELDRYIDGEIESDSAREVRDHLGGCPSCRRKFAEREALGRIVRSAPYFPAPDRLRARVAAAARQSHSRGRLFAYAAAAVLLLATAGGWTVYRSVTSNKEVILEEVVSGHVRSLMADHLVDVRSGDQHTVKPWFVGRLDFSPPVVDLAPIGFPLVGGRMDYLAGRPVAALVYQRRLHTINVFVSPARDAPVSTGSSQSIRGFNVEHWTANDLSFWAVSDVGAPELATFVRALHGS
jgi:anti-sigma factor (TIGR02949 family)